MPEGLQESSTGELLQERYDALDECISTLESVDITFQEEERDAKNSDTEHAEVIATALNDRLNEIREELQAALSDIGCS